MPGRAGFRLESVMKVHSVQANVPGSRVKPEIHYALDTSIGRFELQNVWLGSKKKYEKTYHLPRFHRVVRHKGRFGVMINLRTGRVIARGVVPEWFYHLLKKAQRGRVAQRSRP